jgi:hypothetical protein
MRRALLLALAVVGCKDPAEGTFVGNPTLRARYVDNPDQVGVGGELVTLATAVEPCSAPTVALGAKTFDFEGTEAVIELELPDDDLCGILIVVKELAIVVDDQGVLKTVVGQDFDLSVPAEAIPAGATSLELRLGDDTWLPSFVPLASAGVTTLNAEADPALVNAFFDGLDAGSSFEAINVAAQ